MRVKLGKAYDASVVAFAALVATIFVVFGAVSGLPVLYGVVVTGLVLVLANLWLPSERRPKSLAKWIGPAWALLFLSTMAFDYGLNERNAEAVRGQLEVEFISIDPMPGAIETSHSSSNKTHQALVSRGYKTISAWDDIVGYYVKALAARGWTYRGQTTVRDWGNDLGGKDACFSKGDFSTRLQYAGASANYGWNFAFDMSWGLGDCGQ